MSIETLFETYAAAWEAHGADAIAALHTPEDRLVKSKQSYLDAVAVLEALESPAPQAA